MNRYLSQGFLLEADGRQYEIAEPIGMGASAIAYRAKCRCGNLTTQCILKEYAPQRLVTRRDSDGAPIFEDADAFAKGMEQFLRGGEQQNRIRQMAVLENQTPPITHIFKANRTAYLAVSCYRGTTLDRLTGQSLAQYMAICLTLAKTVGYYHQCGYLCLDLKPENLFILQNAPNDTVTQMIELIDFDSIRAEKNCCAFSCTREWAAPEQRSVDAARGIGRETDIFTIGEIVFFLTFGRHSVEQEHRGFSQYPFDACRAENRKYLERPEIQAIYTSLFRNTLRSSPANRFSSTQDLAAVLEKLVVELNKKEYIIPMLPTVPPCFVGRAVESRQITEVLHAHRVLFLTGIGGIGKSTVVRNYICQNKAAYEILIYLETEGDILHTFTDDMQLQISTVRKRDEETPSAYFRRKLLSLRRICFEKRVLLVIDDYRGEITRELSMLIDCGYDTVIVTRNQPPKNSFATMTLSAIQDTQALFRLIAQNLERNPTQEEQTCFAEIIRLTEGHTLVLELIARQIAAGCLNIGTATERIRTVGFSKFSHEKIRNYKDREEVYGSLATILTALFDASNLRESEKIVLQILSLTDVRGLDRALLGKLVQLPEEDALQTLHREGWITAAERVRMHPVIAETVRGWDWQESLDVGSIMKRHKEIIDIYGGMQNSAQIRIILTCARRVRMQRPHHFVIAMYDDMLGTYYDTLLNGAYLTETESEAALSEKLIRAMQAALRHMERSTWCEKNTYIVEYALSLAAILIRSGPEQHEKAAVLLRKAKAYLDRTEPADCKNRCYYFMTLAWYHTLAKPNSVKLHRDLERAAQIAAHAFPTDLERIDVISIPAANCLFYWDKFFEAEAILIRAIRQCETYPESLPHLRKKADLLRCLLDIANAMQDGEQCRTWLQQLHALAAAHPDAEIVVDVSEEIRELGENCI